MVKSLTSLVVGLALTGLLGQAEAEPPDAQRPTCGVSQSDERGVSRVTLTHEANLISLTFLFAWSHPVAVVYWNSDGLYQEGYWLKTETVSSLVELEKRIQQLPNVGSDDR